MTTFIIEDDMKLWRRILCQIPTTSIPLAVQNSVYD